MIEAESENYELAEEEAATEEETEVEAEAETEVNETEEVVEAESEEEVVEEEQPVVEEVFEAEAEEQSEPTQEEVNYQALYEQNNAQLEDLRARFDEAQNRSAELENTNAQFTATLKNLNTQLVSYRAAEEAAIEAKKNELFELYTNSLSEDEVAKIRNQVNTLTYDELETKLALAFSRKQLGQSVETVKVPLIDTQESEFALFMKKYKK